MKSSLILKSIHLTNFATFEHQEIQFSTQFNALIGETGSGKSLVLDALQLIFGGKADKKLIRQKSNCAIVEAFFECNGPEIKKYLEDIGHPLTGDDQQEIVIKRIIYKEQTAKAFLNFQSSTANTLQRFARRFIDVVGQFENQKLLSETYQLVLLDNFSLNESNIEKYQNYFSEFKMLEREINELKQQEQNRGQQIDFLRFQINEIQKANPSEEEEKELQEQKRLLQNQEERNNLLSELENVMSEGENNILSMLQFVSQRLNSSHDLISDDIQDKWENARSEIEEVSYNLSRLKDVQADDNLSLEEVIDRLDLYQKLKRKFGPTMKDVIEQLAQFEKELEQLDQIEHNITQLESRKEKCLRECHALAELLHQRRNASAHELSERITATITKLKMTGARLEVKVEESDELNQFGKSRVYFIVETNPGEGFHPVKKVASGGELSRILLAIRKELSTQDSISIFLFDEIDTGIGGATALSIGQALQEVSENSQVLAITHLPQVAHFAKRLIEVDKKVINARTFSEVNIFEDESKIQKIKEMTPIPN